MKREKDSFTPKVLVIGALGQIGQELLLALRDRYGQDAVIGSDIRVTDEAPAPFISLDVMNRKKLFEVIEQHQINTLYNLAAILSAKGEQNPEFAWKLNMEGLLNSLEAARHTCLEKIFWPSSIAVFGPNSDKNQTPQLGIMDPTTVYGISKLAGERWCDYYSEKYDVDVRSLRYPGLIGYTSMPGGGTTDYAVEIFHEALQKGTYECFLSADTPLPMMFMPDAIKATIQIMEAPAESIRIRSSYNLGGISFTPAELVVAIQQHLPTFQCSYAPDFRQAIADSWPGSIDDSAASEDWNWQADYDLNAMTEEMLMQLSAHYASVPQP
ncbi:MAG: NAD-dependent epimerase/dehydratase family protein [Bacteroidota bacterium]